MAILCWTLSAVAFANCEREEVERDPLDELGVLGVWVLDTALIDGLVVDFSADDTATLVTGNLNTDYEGEFVTVGSGYTLEGSFVFNVENETVKFTNPDAETLYNYHVTVGRMELEFFLGPKRNVNIWRQIE